MHQLAARMSAHTLSSDLFQDILQEIIFRTTLDHPHHSLYVILAIGNASKDDMFPSSGHVTGTKLPKGTGSGGVGKLQRKKSASMGSTVDEVGWHQLESKQCHYLSPTYFEAFLGD